MNGRIFVIRSQRDVCQEAAAAAEEEEEGWAEGAGYGGSLLEKPSSLPIPAPASGRCADTT
jgi:hypothetical protein